MPLACLLRRCITGPPGHPDVLAQARGAVSRLALAVLGSAALGPAPMPAGAVPLAVNPLLQPDGAARTAAPRPQAGAHRLARANGAHEVLLVDVFINGQRLKDIVPVERLPGGALLLPAGAWTAARLAPLAKASSFADGTPAFSLDAVPGLTYEVNPQRMVLEVHAPATAFVGSLLNVPGSRAVAPARPQPGVMLDYDLSASQGYGSSSRGATLELTAFGNLGSFVGSALLGRSGQVSSATRLDTYWRRDLPERMQMLVVGDAVGVGGGWSRPARYGGIRWGTDFGMQPGVLTLPQITLAGEAALPSTVEVLVNNARRLSQPVQPGPFELKNVPVVTGAGQINLVVRDLLGRETVVSQSYYMAPRLLAPGLKDFSFEAGWLRTGYGRDTTYRDGFGAATWRQGLSGNLTGEGRLELQPGRRAAGVELAGVLGAWGAGRMALATAAGDRQGQAERGHLLQLGFERSTPTGGGALQYEHASRGFAPFGEALGSDAVAQRARERWLASLGGSLGSSPVNGGVSYVQQSRWDGERVRSFGLGASVAVWQRASLNFSLNKRLDSDRAWSTGITISLPLENGIYTALRIERATAGAPGGVVSASYNPPDGLGLGWHTETSTQPSQRASAGLQGNTSQVQWALDLASDARGQVAARASGRGTLGWLAGMPFVSRAVGGGSFVVVEVAGLQGKLEGVPVMRSHQLVARTDSRGRALVTGLLPWQQNRIEIDLLDLPLDVEVAHTVQQVTPYARSGSVLRFEVLRTRQALVVLHQPGGVPVPAGAQVRLLPGGPEFRVGRRGEVWLVDLAAERQRLQVSWPGGGCQLELRELRASGINEKMGPLICTKD
jgi:outer membrane usher protein